MSVASPPDDQWWKCVCTPSGRETYRTVKSKQAANHGSNIRTLGKSWLLQCMNKATVPSIKIVKNIHHTESGQFTMECLVRLTSLKCFCSKVQTIVVIQDVTVKIAADLQGRNRAFKFPKWYTDVHTIK